MMGCATSIASSSSDVLKEAASRVDDLQSPPPTIVLTEQHKKMIVKNWKVLSGDLSGRGSRIFLLIFGRNPLIKSIFSFGHLDGDELVSDPRFKGHAVRFMQAVETLVDNIDNYEETVTPLLNDLGRRHTHFKGFKPIYFNDFQDSIMQVFAEDLGWQFNSLARESWRLVLLFMLTELKRGFTHCLKEKAAHHHADTGAACGSSSSSRANDTTLQPRNNFCTVGKVCDDVSRDVINSDSTTCDV